MVSVKLVSEPGVGTIAAGVAKAYADFYYSFSGYDGGTAAFHFHRFTMRVRRGKLGFK